MVEVNRMPDNEFEITHVFKDELFIAKQIISTTTDKSIFGNSIELISNIITESTLSCDVKTDNETDNETTITFANIIQRQFKDLFDDDGIPEPKFLKNSMSTLMPYRLLTHGGPVKVVYDLHTLWCIGKYKHEDNIKYINKIKTVVDSSNILMVDLQKIVVDYLNMSPVVGSKFYYNEVDELGIFQYYALE